uniref:Glucoamylase BARREL, Starch Binding, Amylose n=1 Tax=Siphoviridae sp. ctmqu18 TaxID=2825655 RepID=A0A8S5V6N0_9CAUD|nr:MAG TPA: Glucoamylase BARREL, Starch Binding, Amylose [Siphoviridae sp. ctmqu18]
MSFIFEISLTGISNFYFCIKYNCVQKQHVKT